MSVASRRGLTFVELLMAATIFSILLVGVSGHLRGSMVAWRRAVSFTDDLQQARVSLAQLEGDLSHAFAFGELPAWEPHPVFTNTELQFYTIAPRPQAGEGDAGSVRFVTYTLDTADEVTSLTKTSQTVQEAHADPAHRTAEPQRLLQPVESWSVEYGWLPAGASTMEWTTPWDHPNQLPKLVKITVRLSRPFPTQRQLRVVVTIPAGTLTP